jgi:gluconokinase
MGYLIGLDLGTTNCKAVALAQDGRLLASASSEYRLYTPHPGWVEQHFEEVWQGALTALKELAQLVDPHQALGLCLSGAMHSSLPVDVAGNPLAPALTWADQRAAPQASTLALRCDTNALYQRTGCPLVPFYHPAKLRWWLEEAPEISRRASHFLLIKDLALYRLSGQWVSDLSVASATGLLDIHRLDWDEEALALAGVGLEQLPQLVSPRAVLGGLSPFVAAQCGLIAGLPVIAGASDGGLANLGAGAAAPGESVITVGTSGAVRRIVAQPQLDCAERTWCYVLCEGRWFAGGAINNGGLSLQWLRQQLYPEFERLRSKLETAEGFERLLSDAATIPPGAGGVLALPYFTGERSPHWNVAARAVIVGLGLEHTRAHVARAVLEGVAFCLADIWDVLQAGFVAPGQVDHEHLIHLTGGITRSPLWAQIVCDVIGQPVVLLEAADASAIGAAMLGQWALGMADSLEALAERVTCAAPLVPDPQRHDLYTERHALFQRLYPLCIPAEENLTQKRL